MICINRQNVASIQTRQNIIDAFWGIYAVKKIDSITVKEIMNKAGYNRSTFYLYFKDVYEVLEQVELSLLPHADRIVKCTDETAKSMDMQKMVELMAQMFSENEKYLTVLLGPKGDPDFAQKLKNNLKEVMMRHLPPHPYSEYLAEYILAARIGLLTYWFTDNRTISIEELITLQHDLMETGPKPYLINLLQQEKETQGETNF